MTLQQIIPRIARILIFLSAAAFAFIESVYMRDHSAALAGRDASVTFWMWAYRALAVAFFIVASFIIGSLVKK